jgi:hypothetical protein
VGPPRCRGGCPAVIILSAGEVSERPACIEAKPRDTLTLEGPASAPGEGRWRVPRAGGAAPRWFLRMSHHPPAPATGLILDDLRGDMGTVSRHNICLYEKLLILALNRVPYCVIHRIAC